MFSRIIIGELAANIRERQGANEEGGSVPYNIAHKTIGVEW